ncbi:MAG: hypothetical protein U5K81_02025 [Trueperaceae bacterium]|nr:hypothetical protein [Trueperaceae bacterium]
MVVRVRAHRFDLQAGLGALGTDDELSVEAVETFDDEVDGALGGCASGGIADRDRERAVVRQGEPLDGAVHIDSDGRVVGLARHGVGAGHGAVVRAVGHVGTDGGGDGGLIDAAVDRVRIEREFDIDRAGVGEVDQAVVAAVAADVQVGLTRVVVADVDVAAVRRQVEAGLVAITIAITVAATTGPIARGVHDDGDLFGGGGVIVAGGDHAGIGAVFDHVEVGNDRLVRGRDLFGRARIQAEAVRRVAVRVHALDGDGDLAVGPVVDRDRGRAARESSMVMGPPPSGPPMMMSPAVVKLQVVVPVNCSSSSVVTEPSTVTW